MFKSFGLRCDFITVQVSGWFNLSSYLTFFLLTESDATVLSLSLARSLSLSLSLSLSCLLSLVQARSFGMPLRSTCLYITPRRRRKKSACRHGVGPTSVTAGRGTLQTVLPCRLVVSKHTFTLAFVFHCIANTHL